MTAPAVAQQSSFNPQEIITMTARLAQILAEEVDLLAEKKVAKIADLQNEKLFLVRALESQKKAVQKDPELVRKMPPTQREELRKVVDIFNGVIQQNHRKLELAKYVNQKIIDIIKQVVGESDVAGVYNGFGKAYHFAHHNLSVTLNKRI